MLWQHRIPFVRNQHILLAGKRKRREQQPLYSETLATEAATPEWSMQWLLYCATAAGVISFVDTRFRADVLAQYADATAGNNSQKLAEALREAKRCKWSGLQLARAREVAVRVRGRAKFVALAYPAAWIALRLACPAGTFSDLDKPASVSPPVKSTSA